MKNDCTYRYTIIDATQGWPISRADSERDAIKAYDAAMMNDSSRDVAIINNVTGEDVTVDLLFPAPKQSKAYIYFVFDNESANNVDEDFILSSATFLDCDEARTFAHIQADKTGHTFTVDECELGENWLANCVDRWEIRPYNKR